MSKYMVEVEKDDYGHPIEEAVEADSLKVEQDTLIFYKEKKISQVFAKDTWYKVLKIN